MRGCNDGYKGRRPFGGAPSPSNGLGKMCATPVGGLGSRRPGTIRWPLHFVMSGSPPTRFSMRLVIIESPYAGDIEANVAYARACVRDSLGRGEAPIASHLLYTQPGILRDDIPAERQWGIAAGLAWRNVADASVVYTDRGISAGMEHGIAAAREAGKPVEFRSLGQATG